ncbi:hypothetical protein [Rhizobium mesoamericanum]|uniref:Uncharacterized protein n=1 Tax=Rhizobium mesoamericanum STM3625 TaxID=1211777 RepID=K0Q3A3_9HYPH|nr:hypothetical protein [Rhizobium mesoamericanum]CCM77129.1 hypothetical protein BN77_4178 [Rhizobium mesoamericanum STM3625]
MSFNEDGKEILVPTVSPDGKLLDENQAIDLYHRTGQHLGIFDNPEDATIYAQTLHNQQDQMYSAPKQGVTLNINGRKVTVDDSFLQLSPEDQEKTVDEIASHLGAPKQDAAQVEQPSADDDSQKSLRSELSAMTQNPAKALYDQRPTWQKPLIAAQDIGNIIGDDLTFGFGDKAAAALRAPFTDKTYAEELAANRQGTQNARDRAGSAAYGADVTAALMLPRLLPAGQVANASAGVLPKLGRFAGGVVKGGAQGAAVGAAQAAGHDTDIGQGAAAGAAFGAAVPAALGIGKTVGGAVLKPVADAVRARANPSGYAAGKIAERLNNGGMSVDQAAARAARDGLSLADVGGSSTRDLLRTTTNIPGPARSRVASQLALRQMGQGDRLKRVVGQTLADPDGYLAAKDEIAETAKKIAGPLYREAEKTPIHFTKELEGIINTPAGRRALAKAEELAANEQVPFKQMFVNIADDGTATFKRVPDQRAWQYIKTALDDMVDAETDSITKKVTNDGRIINNLKNRMLSELDAQNPTYAAARKAWGGQQSLDKALEFGRTAMSQSPESVRRSLAAMGAPEKEAARAGAAEWIRNSIDQAGFTNNAILKFFSNRQQVKNLRALFDNDAQFKTFRQAIFAEAKKRSTYDAVRGNSTTARQMADMFETGGASEGFNTAKTAVTQGVIPAALQFVGSRLRMLGGLTPQVADNISKRLMTTSPEVRAQITSELQRIEQARISAAEKSQAVRALLGRTAAIVGSGAVVQAQQ